MIPVKGKEPGTFVLTSKKDGKKYVMAETTLRQVIEAIGEEKIANLFNVEWVVLTEEEQKLAEEISRGHSEEV